MDRPRSRVQDAGRGVRSIPPGVRSPVAKHEERGRLPAVGRDEPRSLAPIRLSGGGPVEPPRLSLRRAGRRRASGCYRRLTGCSNRPAITGNSGCSLLP